MSQAETDRPAPAGGGPLGGGSADPAPAGGTPAGARQDRAVADAERPVRALWSLGLLSGEVRTVFRRWRTLALLGVLAAVPVLVGVAVKLETGGDRSGRGPAFIADVTNNGLFLVFTALAVTLPVFLPLAVGVVAGDSIAGEAAAGTLRYLLVAPAGRTRLLVAKFASVLVFCLAATAVVAVSALATGALLFPLGDVTLISGTTIPLADGLLRALGIALVVAASLTGIAALGVFISTVTDSGIAAMATTIGVLITVQITDSIPQLAAIGPCLFPHYWLSFADLLRDPVSWQAVGKDLGLQALYAAVFGTAAWARLTTRDITA